MQSKPPVKVPLYAHQQKAFEFVMSIFHGEKTNQTQKKDGVTRGPYKD